MNKLTDERLAELIAHHQRRLELEGGGSFEQLDVLDALRELQSRRAARWIPWNLGDAMPPITQRHWVTLERGDCHVATAGRTRWSGEKPLAYWSEPLPAPYQSKAADGGRLGDEK